MKYTKSEYYEITNVDCVAVAVSLGMEIDVSKRSSPKAIHIKHSGGLYIFPDKNNWYRHSDGRSGFPVNLVMDALSCTKESALEYIKKNVNTMYNASVIPSNKNIFVLPAQVTPNRVSAYLTQTRGIDAGIVERLISEKSISEDAIHHNCMFIGRDIDGKARSCALRGTGSKQFRGEVAGGDKSYSFAINGYSEKLRIFESPIDAMSHATFSKLLGIDWKADHRLSINGCGYMPALQYIKTHDNIKKVVLSLDNDDAGHIATEKIKNKILMDFGAREIRVLQTPSHRKDWNEDLIAFREAEKSGMDVNEFLRKTFPQIRQYI